MFMKFYSATKIPVSSSIIVLKKGCISHEKKKIPRSGFEPLT